MNEVPRRILQVALPLLVVAGGAGIAVSLARSREPAAVVTPRKAVPSVEVVVATPTSWQPRVRTTGTVQPATRSDIVAEVAGRVVEVDPALAEGGFFGAGQPLVRLDARDYDVAVVEATAEVARAKLALELELAEADSARREWQAMQRDVPPPALVVREPQLAEARARVAAAEARLESARRDVERCVIAAPYDGRVLSKSVDLGQFVARNTRLAQLYAIDAAEVRLPLPDAELAFLDLDVQRAPSGAFADARGPRVVLRAEFGGRERTWEGRIVRTEGQLDARSRMVHMVARVDAPYRVDEPGSAPLLVNQFVSAELVGPVHDDVFVLPRAALRGADRVLVVEAGDRIRHRAVRVLRKERDVVVVEDGIAAGDRICVTPLDAVVDGMAVRVDAVGPAAEAGR